MITEIEWTDHASDRLEQRKVSPGEIEGTVRYEHDFRTRNPGDGDWQVTYHRRDGQRFGVVYDHPVDGDASRARVVTILRLRQFRRR